MEYIVNGVHIEIPAYVWQGIPTGEAVVEPDPSKTPPVDDNKSDASDESAIACEPCAPYIRPFNDPEQPKFVYELGVWIGPDRCNTIAFITAEGKIQHLWFWPSSEDTRELVRAWLLLMDHPNLPTEELTSYELDPSFLETNLRQTNAAFGLDMGVLVDGYRPSGIRLTTEDMRSGDIDHIVRRKVVQVSWILLQEIARQHHCQCTTLENVFNVHRLFPAVDSYLRHHPILLLVQNEDSTVSVVPDAFWGVVRGHLVSFPLLCQFMVLDNTPFKYVRFRTWRKPSDLVSRWWQAHFPNVPVENSTTRHNPELLYLFATLPNYLTPEAIADLDQAKRKGQITRWWETAVHTPTTSSRGSPHPSS